MRLLFAYVVSALVHLGVIGGMAYWLPQIDVERAQFVVTRGEPITATFSLPSAAAEAEVEVEVEKEATEVPEPAPPADVAADERRPAEHSLPEIDAVPLEKPLDRRPDDSLAAVEPSAVPPELPPTEVDFQPAAAPELNSAEQAVEQPSELTKRPKRDVQPVELARQPSIAMPFQQAVQVGVQVDELPRKLPANAPPHYPAEALLAGIEGRVLVRVLVGGDGQVQSAAVHATSGAASLDRAVAAVRRWRFSPARRAGHAVAHEVLVPVRFSILGG